MSSKLTNTTPETDEDTRTPPQIRDQVLAYYTAAALDYGSWSRGFNMHFGFWRRGINPFKRETMLEELNSQVLARLGIIEDTPARLVDLGGGTGATARAAVTKFPKLSVDVVTIVPKQIEIGETLNRSAIRGSAVSFHCADFTSTGLPSNCADAVCMIESACHAEGPTKAALLKEAFRLLKPGGRLVMVDAMLLREVPQSGLLSRLMNHVYRRWCIAWAVPELCRVDLVNDKMMAIGFQQMKFENWSWNVAPSVAHVPLFASLFAIIEILKAKGALPLWRWRHIIASLLTPLLGLRRCTFVYGALTARKPAAAD